VTERSRLSGWHPESAFRDLLEKIEGYINHPTVERNILMAIQADVQKLIDEVAQNKDLVTSVAQALQVQGKQIDDLKTQITGLQAGQVLTVDDLTAIQGAVTQLGETNTALQTATPANTAGQPAVAPATPDVPPSAPATPAP
jgi:hypothetical protein